MSMGGKLAVSLLWLVKKSKAASDTKILHVKMVFAKKHFLMKIGNQGHW